MASTTRLTAIATASAGFDAAMRARSGMRAPTSTIARRRTNHHRPDCVSHTSATDQYDPEMRCACAAIIQRVPTKPTSAAITRTVPTRREPSSDGVRIAAITVAPINTPIPA